MRALARWAITPLLAAPASSWALGLGEIEMQSALNQPFRAEIALLATPDELQTLRIAVPDNATFQRYGLDRPNFLGSFEFRVVTSRDGRSVIQVSSRESVTEPFVELLLEATWPRGRTLKVYTVFLDPPVLLPAPAVPQAVAPAETRTSGGAAPGGPINRPAPAPAVTPPQPAPAPAVTEPNVSRATPSAPRAPVSADGGAYGPVQRGETLSAIADRLRPEGVTRNQMMIALFEANPQAFGGNINVLRAGTTLRLPDATTIGELAVTTANAEVRRQIDEWRDRTTQGGQLRLLPPAEEVARAPEPAPAPTQAVPSPAEPPAPAAGAGVDPAVAAGIEESRRLVELRNSELQNLQQQAEAAAAPAEPPPAAEPGVDLETEQLFADETEPAPAEPEAEAEAEAPAPAPTAAPTPVAAEPSLVSRALDWLESPFVWIGAGVAVVLFSALWFVRRRRSETEDVTGRWEALESETDEDRDSRDATERLRRQLPEQTIVVEEQHAEGLRPAPQADTEPAPRRAAPAKSQGQAARTTPAADETLSSQTVINLDQADAVAEADFHIAYGLYDQAAELVQKALESAPDRRDLKLKLLEVYFMWGNKDAFLKAAHGLRADLKQGDDPDWNKVVIMGRQICPDERLFTEATAGAGRVDVDLEAGGDAPLDLAFDETAAISEAHSPSSGLDFNLESSDQRPAPKAAPRPSRDFSDAALDIGSKTAAGLEAALFESTDDDDTGKRTTPDIPADALAITQESPTIERLGRSDWATAENTGLQLSSDAPTMETPTIESPAAKSASTTMQTKTVAIPRRGAESPTVEQPALGSATSPGEYTAEIDLDDLGLDVKDIEGLPTDLGDLPMAAGRETDTRQQPALREEDALLSATGVTKVLHEEDESLTAKTSVLQDEDATMMAPGFDEGTSTMTGTAVLDGRHERDSQTGNTSLVKALGKKNKGGVDLDLDDLTAALHGADTVEQPRANSFSRDVFGGGNTPVDMDIGRDVSSDDAPTGTEEAALDPQTMTEVGTKLDLARAYIDMGDPEGARSILEEVLDEGDTNQRREAQGLIDALSA